MRVRYTPRAFSELQEILAYIDEHSPTGARNVKARILDVINLASEQPRAGILIGKRRLRRIAVHPYPYLIFYRIAEDQLVIHGVRHGARNSAKRPD